MAKIITRIDLPAPQIFTLSLKGLNINTNLNVYFDGKKLPYYSTVVGQSLSSVYPTGNANGVPTTDGNGASDITFILQSNYGSLVGYSESSVIDAFALDSAAKKVVIVDKASIDTDILPSNYAELARCVASTIIYKTVSQSNRVEQKVWDTPEDTALTGSPSLNVLNSIK